MPASITTGTNLVLYGFFVVDKFSALGSLQLLTEQAMECANGLNVKVIETPVDMKPRDSEVIPLLTETYSALWIG